MQNKLSYYRNLGNIKQKDIARLLDVDPSQISQWENNHYSPSLKVALAISQVFSRLLGMDVTVNDLWQLDKHDLR